MEMEKHLTILSVGLIALGVVGIGAAIVVFVVIAGGGLISGDGTAMMITASVATALAVFLAVVSLPSVIAGIGLMQRANWARVLTLIIAAMNLLNIPVGTALGVYAFWVLLNDKVTPLFVPPQPA